MLIFIRFPVAANPRCNFYQVVFCLFQKISDDQWSNIVASVLKAYLLVKT